MVALLLVSQKADALSWCILNSKYILMQCTELQFGRQSLTDGYSKLFQRNRQEDHRMSERPVEYPSLIDKSVFRIGLQYKLSIEFP